MKGLENGCLTQTSTGALLAEAAYPDLGELRQGRDQEIA